MLMNSVHRVVSQVGRNATQIAGELGYIGSLFGETLYFLFLGPARGQPVRWHQVLHQMRQIGSDAIPIVALLSLVIGLSLAINGIAQLKAFGAESAIVVGVAIGVTREFGPLITGIVVAGRTASALAARIGSMVVSQEIDALRVIGVEPSRYLAAPPLLAAIVMLPCLTIVADFFAILGGGLFSAGPLEMTLYSYFHKSLEALESWDIVQGLIKSVVFGILIVLIGVGTGFTVKGGAEGVGQATTRAVVVSICAILIADVIFSFFLTR